MNLPHLWAAFKSCLVDSDNMLKKHKEKFRTGLLQDADDFKRTVTEIAETFEAEGPFTSDASQEQVRLALSCTLWPGSFFYVLFMLNVHTLSVHSLRTWHCAI